MTKNTTAHFEAQGFKAEPLPNGGVQLWPDNTKLPHVQKRAAINRLCAQSREAQPLPAVWPVRAANKKAVAQ